MRIPNRLDNPPEWGNRRRVKLSIIIPAFNEERLLPATLDGINRARSALDRRGWAHEVIVADNNSTDRTAAVARAAGARVVFEPVNQIGRARNAGAAAADGDWLLFLDADTLPSHRLFARTAAAIESGRYLAGGALIDWETDILWANCAAKIWNGVSALMHWAAGSFLFARAEVFRELGGFNEELYVSEELDLSHRLNRAARRQGLHPLHIITDAPVLTSSRKLHLYSGAEIFRFFTRSILNPRRHFRHPDHCHIWYDGRR